MTLKELHELKGKAVDAIRKLAEAATEEGRSWTDEDQTALNKAESDLKQISQKIAIAKRAQELEGRNPDNFDDFRRDPRQDDSGAGEQRSAEEIRSSAIRGWLASRGGAEISELQQGDLRNLGMTGEALNVELLGMREHRALSSQLGPGGGFSVGGGMVMAMEQAMLDFGGMREISDIIRTTNGEPIQFPTSNDTGNEGYYVGESQDRSTVTDPTIANNTLNAYTLTSGIIRVPFELLQDAAFDIEAWLGAMMGERNARRGNRAMTTGNGSNKPTGITLSTTLGVTADAVAAITTDELKELKYSVKRPYRDNNAFWMMEDDTMLAISKLKDGDGQYIWQQGITEADPDRLYGVQIVPNEDMASLGASAITVLYGQRGHYKAREVTGVMVQRTQDRYIEYGQVGFIATMRHDGRYVNAGTNPVKHLVQASS